MLLHEKIFIVFLITALVFTIVPIATWIDIKLYKNKNTRSRVATEIRSNSSYSKLREVFLERNIFEALIFLSGFFSSFILFVAFIK